MKLPILDLVVHTAPDLHQLVEQLNGTRPNQRICRHRPSPPPQSTGPIDAPGQAGKALALAAAGGHHLLVGPPGCGKSRLAHQLPQLLLEPEEALTITRIRSVAGEQQEPLNPEWIRPFRAPHHSCSAAALLGGGHNPRPGEVSLAHGGVLFLDELAEFPRAVLDQLRQPLEEGVYRLSRARLNASFPAGITLVAATNPALWLAEIVTMAAAAATANGSATGNASPVRCWIDWICSCDWNGAARPPSAAP